jgi:hypothetical protein
MATLNDQMVYITLCFLSKLQQLWVLGDFQPKPYIMLLVNDTPLDTSHLLITIVYLRYNPLFVWSNTINSSNR